MDLTCWQLNTSSHTESAKPSLSRDQSELLRKILLAKGIKLESEMMKIESSGVVTVVLPHYQLVFSDVNLTDTNSVINLSKISAMLQDQEEKKRTWYKLKNIDL
jgi:hypothetical protein